jgi:integrase
MNAIAIHLSQSKNSTVSRRRTAKDYESAIRQFDADGSAQRRQLWDGDGLFLLLRRNCTPTWFLNVELPTVGTHRRRVTRQVCTFSSLKLADVRRRAAQLRAEILSANQSASALIFSDYVAQWRENETGHLSPSTKKRLDQIIDLHVLRPENGLADLPLGSITFNHLLRISDQLCAQKKVLTAKLVAHTLKQIFAEAGRRRLVSTPLPTDGLQINRARRGAKLQHRQAITNAKDFGELLAKIDGLPESSIKIALQLLPLVFLRPGKELLRATWHEIDFDAAIWTIPEERMKVKGRGDHLVPLSCQALSILRAHREKTNSTFIFPGIHGDGPLSNSTLLREIKRISQSKQSCHGFRRSFQTIFKDRPLSDKRPFDQEAISLQLAHRRNTQEENLGYDGSQLLAERRELMQRWSDIVDGLKS